ncbi:MAG: Na+/H+ antiporter NhaA [Pirellulaceae bacterium]|nr:Na+/H+ antiporter NhaA [Pirellulaceae bacterium]
MFGTKLFKEFFASERAGGLILIAVTIVSLIVANSPIGEQVIHFFHSKILGMSIEHWVNDGLMVIFFLMIGLELEREIYEGELSTFRKAALPVFAALGGMLVPASIHAIFNYGSATQSGAGIPMATDIAFSLGVLSLFGTKVPYSLKVFLAALAIADDLGAIIAIAVFYTKDLNLGYLAGAASILAALFALNRTRMNTLWPYLLGGLGMWYCLLHSGIHATIGGVLLAFVLPFSRKREDCVSHKLQHRLHFPVAFILLPMFAIVNTCIPLSADWYTSLLEPNSKGIFLGLVVGKPLGILLFCWLAIQIGFGSLADGLTWNHLVGAGFLAGIGFTMSIFVSILAFADVDLVKMSQVTVLIASLASALLGAAWFAFFVRASKPEDVDPVSEEV